MKEAVSHPPKANVRDDQKIISLKRRLGLMLAAWKEVADLKRCHAIAPMPRIMSTGSHIASAPALCSHLPTSSPTTFTTVMIVRATIEKMMWKFASFDRWPQRPSRKYNALLAAK